MKFVTLRLSGVTKPSPVCLIPQLFCLCSGHLVSRGYKQGGVRAGVFGPVKTGGDDGMSKVNRRVGVNPATTGSTMWLTPELIWVHKDSRASVEQRSRNHFNEPEIQRHQRILLEPFCFVPLTKFVFQA